MPIAFQLPPPQNWQDFEVLCRQLLELEWGVAVQRHGSAGQAQQGVDLFAQRDGGWHGAQCKLKDQWRGARATAKELAAEVGKARKFAPNLARFTLLTTAPRDAALQTAARELSADQEARFAVEVLGWDDLAERVQRHPDLLRQWYGWCLTDVARDREIASHLQALRNRLDPLPIAAIVHANAAAPRLETVYASLDVLEDLRVDDVLRGRGEDAAAATSARDEPTYLRALRQAVGKERKDKPWSEERRPRRLRAVEFLAAHPRAVLLGPPGAGKSAFAAFVAISLAKQRLDGEDAGLAQLAPRIEGEPWTPRETWPHGPLLPLFVELRAFTADGAAFPAEHAPIHADHLLDHLAGAAARCPVPAAMVPILRQELLGQGKGRGVLLLLDGLDETPNAEAIRQRLQQVVLAFARQYPHARILVTSRPYAYRSDATWRLPGFAEETLAPLSEPSIAHFVRAWYGALEQRLVTGDAACAQRADALLARLARDPALRPFRERPLMLTLLTSQHASGRMADGGRAAIYGESVQLLFDRWNEVAHHGGAEYFTERFQMRREDVLDALARVAHRIHGEQGRNEAGAAPIPFKLLWDELGAARPQAVGTDERRLLEYLDERAGILLAEGKEVFRFPHRSFQEFLAARWLKADDDYPARLVACVRADPVLWREVLAFVVLLHAHENSLASVWCLLDELFDGAATAADATTARLAIAVGSAFAESERLRDKAREPQGAARAKIERLRTLLVECLERGVLAAGDRVEAGEALGRLGDPRIGHRPENFLPVREGAREGLGRFPVTVQEFAEFVAAGGYATDRYWEPDGGLAVRREESWTEPRDWAAQREHGNRPVVGVSWFEAAAYCRWRSETTGADVRLPADDDWKAAAMHSEGVWPWGRAEVTAEHANYGMNVGAPTPVGCYPAGAGRRGHFDLAGNVWEWMRDDGAPAARGSFRRLRGGAWHGFADGLRIGIAPGHVFVADDRFFDVGFRVVAPASR